MNEVDLNWSESALPDFTDTVEGCPDNLASLNDTDPEYDPENEHTTADGENKNKLKRPFPPRLTEAEKKLRRQASNREAARRSRERKNQLIAQLSEEILKLENENDELSSEVSDMSSKNSALLENVCQNRSTYHRVMEENKFLRFMYGQLTRLMSKRNQGGGMSGSGLQQSTVLSPPLGQSSDFGAHLGGGPAGPGSGSSYIGSPTPMGMGSNRMTPHLSPAQSHLTSPTSHLNTTSLRMNHPRSPIMLNAHQSYQSTPHTPPSYPIKME